MKEAEFWKGVTGSEVDTGHCMVPFQCVPDGTKDKHRAIELGWLVSGHELKIKSPCIQYFIVYFLVCGACSINSKLRRYSVEWLDNLCTLNSEAVEGSKPGLV
jgi:hypothetical protein